MLGIKNINVSSAFQGILVVFVALVVLEAGYVVQYYQTRKIVTENAYRRAQDNIDRVEQDFTRIAELVECAVRNNSWSAGALATQPDSLWALTRGIVEDNPLVYGSAVAMMENYGKKTGRFFSPYAFRDGDVIRSVQLGTEEYDYTHKEWFVRALEAREKGYWSEPYYDEGGGDKLMITYSVPIYDHKGTLAAVLTADVALDWVSDRLAAIEDYPYSLKMLISKTGSIMATSPSYDSINRRNIIDLAEEMDDGTDFREINRDMLAGEEGSRRVSLQGKPYYVFYDKMQKTGWFMSMSIPEEEIFGELRMMNRNVLGIQLLGILMLLVILWVTIRNQHRLMVVNEKKSRMDSELQVASNIQMAMVPKVFPPFPNRKDIDIYASLTPAKEVGGDLYDYFIRDERLYFCIGDVSGKGVPASLVMSEACSFFRTIAGHEKSPARIVNSINRNLVEVNTNDMFVTFFCGVLDMATGHLRYCNAGHNNPVVLTRDSAELLPVVPNIPLGVMDGLHFREQELDLKAGMGLFLYTDGLNEAENANLNQFGMDRAMKAMDQNLSAQEQVEKMIRNVHAFVGEAPQSDDLTLLYIRYMNESPQAVTERHLVLHNDIQQIPQLAEFMEFVAQTAKIDSVLTNSLNLAVEEAVTNVMLYAYPAGTDGLVDIGVLIRRDLLEFSIVDGGKAFDPTAAPEADITLNVEDRPIGGLGIFLVRQIMDDVSYERKDARNILTMKKNLL